MSLLSIALATSPRVFLTESSAEDLLIARGRGDKLPEKTNFFDILAAVSEPLTTRIFERNLDVLWPDDFKSFVLRMLQPDPRKRASASQLLEDPYFQGVDSAAALQSLETDWDALFPEDPDSKFALLSQILQKIREHQGEGSHAFTKHALADLAQSLGLQPHSVTKAFLDNGMSVS